jgi:hypothetical protein
LFVCLFVRWFSKLRHVLNNYTVYTFNIHINIYHSSWKQRQFIPDTHTDGDTSILYYNLSRTTFASISTIRANKLKSYFTNKNSKTGFPVSRYATNLIIKCSCFSKSYVTVICKPGSTYVVQHR